MQTLTTVVRPRLDVLIASALQTLEDYAIEHPLWTEEFLSVRDANEDSTNPRARPVTGQGVPGRDTASTLALELWHFLLRRR